MGSFSTMLVVQLDKVVYSIKHSVTLLEVINEFQLSQC